MNATRPKPKTATLSIGLPRWRQGAMTKLREIRAESKAGGAPADFLATLDGAIQQARTGSKRKV